MSSARAAVVAGASYAGAGFALLMGILTAEMKYPVTRHYSTRQEISDLGATRPPHSVITQPSAAIFDATMLVAGSLLILAAWATWRVLHDRALLSVSALFGGGTMLVGAFPGNTSPHPLVAMIAFTCSAGTAVLAARVTPAPLRWLSLVLGCVSLAALAIGLLGDSSPVARSIGLGGVERWIVFPMIFWLPLFGGYLLAGPRRERASAHADKAYLAPSPSSRTSRAH